MSELIDNKYLDGVYYNDYKGRFQKHEIENEHVVILSVYDEEINRVKNVRTNSLIKVKDSAVNDPVKYFKEMVHRFYTDRFVGNKNRFEKNEGVSFRYARKKVEIREKK